MQVEFFKPLNDEGVAYIIKNIYKDGNIPDGFHGINSYPVTKIK